MAEPPDERNPVDQLVDLFVYAPVGLLYEYEEIIPKLVDRGKSQVQLARVLGKLALNRGGGQEAMTMLATAVATSLAKQVTEIGAAIGLAPPGSPRPAGGAPVDVEPVPAPPPPPPAPPPQALSPDADAGSDGDGPGGDHGDAGADGAEEDDRPLPIAGYDDLNAKEIIGLLDDLEPSQLARIRSHEEANRARKTVLGKLDRLDG